MRCRKGEKGHCSQVASVGMAHMHHTRNSQHPEMSGGRGNSKESKSLELVDFRALTGIHIQFLLKLHEPMSLIAQYTVFGFKCAKFLAK